MVSSGVPGGKVMCRRRYMREVIVSWRVVGSKGVPVSASMLTIKQNLLVASQTLVKFWSSELRNWVVSVEGTVVSGVVRMRSGS